MPISLNPATKSLILKYNNFQTIDASISFYPSLQNLDLSCNELKILPGKIFITQRNLESLNLSDNKIQELTDDAFSGLKRLKRLAIKTNKLRYIKNKTFKSLRRLEILDLSENLISEIHHKLFKNLNSLKVLKLHKNHLRIVPSEAFSSASNLIELDLSDNNIIVIESHAFKYLHSLALLNLAKNNLSTMDVDGLPGLERLEALYLEDNNFSEIPTVALSKVTSLRKIFLGGNPLKQIHKNALVGNTNLNVLNISHCSQLSGINAGAFKPNNLLKTVVISDNADLEYIDSEAFNTEVKVENVDFRANHLSSLSDDLLNWNSVNILQLSKNPWHCDCDLKWLKESILNMVNSSCTRKVVQIAILDEQ